jgi:hypothetical protein
MPIPHQRILRVERIRFSKPSWMSERGPNAERDGALRELALELREPARSGKIGVPKSTPTANIRSRQWLLNTSVWNGSTNA